MTLARPFKTGTGSWIYTRRVATPETNKTCFLNRRYATDDCCRASYPALKGRGRVRRRYASISSRRRPSLTNDPDLDPTPPQAPVAVRIFRKVVDVKPAELKALVLGFVYYFLVLSSYYVIRPIRDDFGAAGGVENLPWMFTGTLVTMLVANTLFSKLVARFSRRRFIPIAYRFFIANLLIF